MGKEIGVSTLQDHLGYWIRIVSNAISHTFARQVEAEGITVAEWVFLRMLYDYASISPSLIAVKMGMTKGAISKLANRLIEKGVVHRIGCLNDKRAQTLSLNEAGRILVPKLAALADYNDTSFFHCLSQRERLQLESLLRKIISHNSIQNVPTD